LEILTETRHISSSKNLRYPQVGGIEKTWHIHPVSHACNMFCFLQHTQKNQH
jgi:hypothetical protein